MTANKVSCHNQCILRVMFQTFKQQRITCMFIKQAVLNATRMILPDPKQLSAIHDTVFVQFFFLATLKNYFFNWAHTHNNFIIPQTVRQKATKNKIILVLDMDQTLVHTRSTSVQKHNNFTRTQIDGDIMFVEPRPMLKQFLKAAAQIFTLYVYTAGKKNYADKVLNIIDPQGLIQKRFYRDSCKKVNGNLVKDLKFLKKTLRVKEQMVLVDDNKHSIEHNYPFAVFAVPFEGKQEDCELIGIFEKILKFYV